MWPISCMNKQVTFLITWICKTFATYVTLVWFFSCVRTYVTCQIEWPGKMFITYYTRVWFFSCNMLLQLTCIHKTLSTNFTLVLLFTCLFSAFIKLLMVGSMAPRCTKGYHCCYRNVFLSIPGISSLGWSTLIHCRWSKIFFKVGNCWRNSSWKLFIVFIKYFFP